MEGEIITKATSRGKAKHTFRHEDILSRVLFNSIGIIALGSFFWYFKAYEFMIAIIVLSLSIVVVIALYPARWMKICVNDDYLWTYGDERRMAAIRIFSERKLFDVDKSRYYLEDNTFEWRYGSKGVDGSSRMSIVVRRDNIASVMMRNSGDLSHKNEIEWGLCSNAKRVVEIIFRKPLTAGEYQAVPLLGEKKPTTLEKVYISVDRPEQLVRSLTS